MQLHVSGKLSPIRQSSLHLACDRFRKYDSSGNCCLIKHVLFKGLVYIINIYIHKLGIMKYTNKLVLKKFA